MIVILQILVVGCLLQSAAFFVQFLALPFPAFALSFVLGGIGMVLQVGIIFIYMKNYEIIFLLPIRKRLRVGLSQLFKRTLNTKQVISMLHMVMLFSNTNTLTELTIQQALEH